MNVLMIEDNESVCEMMSMFFEKEQFQGHFYHDGLEGYNAYAESPSKWDIVLLDINLPSMDGITICRNIRKISKETPIIMLTAQDSESDQVIGLEMGADDYVTKPFSPLTKSVKINTVTREAYYNNQLIENLTPKEFDLLLTFVRSPKRVFNREQLLKQLWEDPFYGDERTVDAHIKKLRQKIEVIGPQIIQTVWGVGYKYEDPGDH